jgi:excisionase family DNA binding protein
MNQKYKENDLRLLSVKEACERLGIRHWAFYQLVHQHALKTLKIGKRRLVSTRALNEFIDNLEQYGA